MNIYIIMHTFFSYWFAYIIMSKNKFCIIAFESNYVISLLFFHTIILFFSATKLKNCIRAVQRKIKCTCLMFIIVFIDFICCIALALWKEKKIWQNVEWNEERNALQCQIHKISFFSSSNWIKLFLFLRAIIWQ